MGDFDTVWEDFSFAQIFQKVHFMQKWHKYICICIYLAIKCDQCRFCMKCTFFRYLGLLILCQSRSSHPHLCYQLKRVTAHAKFRVYVYASMCVCVFECDCVSANACQWEWGRVCASECECMWMFMCEHMWVWASLSVNAFQFECVWL